MSRPMFLRWVSSSSTAITQLKTISEAERSPKTRTIKIGKAIPALIELSDT